jgi:hypothetical protein
MLITNVRGGFAFLRGISPYSAGVVARPGFEIEFARLERAVPLDDGFAAVDAQLRRRGRPRQALCAMALRSPRPFTFAEFAEFNEQYVERLKQWDVLQEGLNPVARTNVAPALDPPAEPSLQAFAYTVPSPAEGDLAPRATFVVAGAGELPEGALDAPSIVRLGDVSAGGMLAKVRCVMGLMEGRLSGLGVGWRDVTATGVYTVREIAPLLEAEILGRMGPAVQHGLSWHFSRPPVAGIEYEMDLRGCRREVVLGA